MERPCRNAVSSRDQTPCAGFTAVSLHAMPQLLSRTRKPGLSRCYRDTQLFGEIRQWQPLNVPQHKHVPQQYWNAFNLSLYHHRYFAAAQLAFRIQCWGRQLYRFVSIGGTPLIEVNEQCSPPAPNEHQALILDNPTKPAREFGLAVKLIKVLERFPARILCFLLRLSMIAENGGRQTDATMMMAANQFVKCASISAACGVDEVRIRNYFNDVRVILHI